MKGVSRVFGENTYAYVPRRWSPTRRPEHWLNEHGHNLFYGIPNPGPEAHQVVSVFTLGGRAYVDCSCSRAFTPRAEVWLSEHFEGSVDAGARVLAEFVRTQSTG